MLNKFPLHLSLLTRIPIALILASTPVLGAALPSDSPAPSAVSASTLERSHGASRSVERAALTQVSIHDYTDQKLSTRALTLADALREGGVYIEPEDRVEPSLDTALTGAPIEVSIQRAAWSSASKTEKIPFETVTAQDPNLAAGKKVVTQEGSDGSKTEVLMVATLPDGTQTASRLMATTVTAPVPEKVSVGTKVAPKPSPARSSSKTPSFKAPSPSSARQMGLEAVRAAGWGNDQFACLDSLWTRESGWNAAAANRSSGAYGIPQALPGSKMASAGSDWKTNPRTQIAWGIGYIKGRYGTPCGAWSHSQSHGWY